MNKKWLFLVIIIFCINSVSATFIFSNFSPVNGATNVDVNPTISLDVVDDCATNNPCGVSATTVRVEVRQSTDPAIFAETREIADYCTITQSITNGIRIICDIASITDFNLDYCHDPTFGDDPVQITVTATNVTGGAMASSSWSFWTEYSTNSARPTTYDVKTTSNTATIAWKAEYFANIDSFHYGPTGSALTHTGIIQPNNYYTPRILVDNLASDSSYDFEATLSDRCGNTHSYSGSFTTTKTPSINTIQGTILEGQTITIGGNDFGIKNPVAPLRWDNFQNGNPGIPSAATRYPSVDEGAVFDTQAYATELRRTLHYSTGQQRFSGDITLLQDYDVPISGVLDGPSNNKALGVIYDSYDWYATWWAYRDDYEGTAARCTNTKLFGNFNAGVSGWTGLPESRWEQYFNQNSGHMQMNDCNGVNQANNYNGGFPHFNEWIRVERYMDKSNVGYAYGKINNEFSGDILGDFNVCQTPFTGFIMGNYFRVEDGTGATLNQYIGEMYVDTTPARIELCNNAVYSSASHCEIQIPHTTWNNNQINFEVNLGTFQTGNTAYLYVIDKYDTPSNSYEIIIGDTYSETPVTSPTIYGISDNTLTNGQTISISGAGFGIKNPVAPLIWDDFESGNLGSEVRTPVIGNDWLLLAIKPHYTDADSWAGDQSAYFEYTGGNGGLSQTFDLSQYVFGSAKIRWQHSNPTDYFNNRKFFRFTGYNEDWYEQNLYFHADPYLFVGEDRVMGGGNFNPDYTMDVGYYTAGASMNTIASAYLEDNNWHSIDLYGRAGTPDVANGMMGTVFDGITSTRDNILSVSTAAHNTAYSSFSLGGYLETTSCELYGLHPNPPPSTTCLDPSGPVDGYYLWVDDVYVDTTLARVMICDKAQFQTTNFNCEIQIPHSTWSGNTVQFSVNQGSFTSSDVLFLFVVDADGEVSNGFPVSFDDSGVVYSDYDLNRDTFIDFSDLVQLVTQFGSTTSNYNTIFVNDGVINILDLILLINNFD